MQVVALGDVMFSLSYLPSAERLTVVVVAAKNLNKTPSKSSTNTLSSISLIIFTSSSCSSASFVGPMRSHHYGCTVTLQFLQRGTEPPLYGEGLKLGIEIGAVRKSYPIGFSY